MSESISFDENSAHQRELWLQKQIEARFVMLAVCDYN